MAIHLFCRCFRLESRRYFFRMRHNHAPCLNRIESDRRHLVILQWRFFQHFPVGFVHLCPHIFEKTTFRFLNIFDVIEKGRIIYFVRRQLIIVFESNRSISQVNQKTANSQSVINNITLVSSRKCTFCCLLVIVFGNTADKVQFQKRVKITILFISFTVHQNMRLIRRTLSFLTLRNFFV